MKTKLLFICSGNLDRSPTAEDLFISSDKYDAKSAGTHSDAVKVVTQDYIDWADTIITMCEREDGHQTYLKENFDLKGKQLFDLDIPDLYHRRDPVLVKLLKDKLNKILPGVVI